MVDAAKTVLIDGAKPEQLNIDFNQADRLHDGNKQIYKHHRTMI